MPTPAPAAVSAAMVEEINRLRKANESLGGSFEVRVFGLVPGLGSHISWEDRLDGRLAGAVASIQSVKGVAIGEAWEVAGRPGSEAHDEIFWSRERGYYRETNHAGGLEGGMTNGLPLSVRAAPPEIALNGQFASAPARIGAALAAFSKGLFHDTFISK